MGGLTSGPRPSSAQPQVVYVSQPAVAVPSAPALDPTPASSDAQSEQSVAEVRESNLLRRDRGRFGTVQTGFSGLLNTAENTGGRKSLLGE